MERNKRKKYFSSNLMMKKRRNLFLQVGYKGFISTCNGNEKQCVRESYNILNEYADKIYGEEDWKKKVDPTEPTEESNDVMDDLDKEIEGYKAKKSGEVERRFLAVDTGVLNCVFIKTNLEDPTSLLDAIVRDLFCSKLKKTRFLLRMIPIEVTCKAYEEDIKKAAGPLFDKYFKSEPTSFSIVFNRRHNSNVDRDTVIKDLAQLVSDRNSKHVVNLTHPTHAIIVEVMKNICGLSVIRNYFDFSKYNFSNICGIDTSFDRHPTSVNESKVESQDEPKSCTDEGSKKEEKASSDEQVNDTYAKGETLNESNDEPVDPTRPNVEVSESDNDLKVATKET